ncbi:MAG TPA: hypothetical protein VMA73_06650 [Streptosporangiaceae bacterium]|nr:hypothetical protein [Streptosporangiaceae bacterium]
MVGELLQSRRILHPATPEITIGRLGALYEAVAKARSDLSRSVSDRADGALETLHVDTLVKCALGTTGNPDMSAIFSSLLAIPEFVPCGSVSLSCAIRTSKVTDSAVIEEFCRLVTSLPEKYLRHTSKAPLRTVPDVDDLADHGDWVGGQHAHARIAVDLAGRRLHQLAQRWQFMRIDGTGTLSTAKTLTGLGDVRAVGRTWSRWFASLGHHPEVLSRQASVVMSIPDDAILLVPADAVHSLARELRADFERCFPPCRLRWAAAELNERSTPFSVAECYSSQLRAARRAAVSG